MPEGTTPTAALLDGRYQVGESLGRGGMSTVYRAEDTYLERTVAIKILRDDDQLVGFSDRMHTEKALQASLSHPSLVTLFDARLERTGPRYLVMEFIDGPTLADRMFAGPLPAEQVAALAQDLAEALSAVHAAGIVHRDVKPSNVLLAPRKAGRTTAKLADFGIACEIDAPAMTSPGVVMGTLAYMAPEQVRGQRVTPAGDVFSLGLVLLEALTGERGYPAAVGIAAAVARVSGPPEIPEDIDPGWRDLLDRMTRTEPSERPTADEVAAAAHMLAPRTTTGSPAAAPVAGAASRAAARKAAAVGAGVAAGAGVASVGAAASVGAGAVAGAGAAESAHPATGATSASDAPATMALGTSGSPSGPGIAAHTPAERRAAAEHPTAVMDVVPLRRNRQHRPQPRRRPVARTASAVLAGVLLLGAGGAGTAALLGAGAPTSPRIAAVTAVRTPAEAPADGVEQATVEQATQQQATQEQATQQAVAPQPAQEAVVEPATPQDSAPDNSSKGSEKAKEASQQQGPPSWSGNKGPGKKDDE